MYHERQGLVFVTFDDESVSSLVKGRPCKFQLGRVKVGNDNMSNCMSRYSMK